MGSLNVFTYCLYNYDVFLSKLNTISSNIVFAISVVVVIFYFIL